MTATKSARAADPVALRNAWLAGLGLASIARRETGHAAQAAARAACRMLSDAGTLAGDARDIARGIAITLRERAEPLVSEVVARAGAGIAPVLGGITRVVQRLAPRPAATARKSAPRRRTATARR